MNMHGRNSSAAGVVLKDILPTLAQEAHGGIPLTFNAQAAAPHLLK